MRHKKNIHWDSDLELTQAAARQEPSAQSELVNQLMDRVRRLAVYLSGPVWDEDDLAQAALIQILKSAGTYRGESSLGRWADRITVHTAYKQIEKHKRREQLWSHQRPSAEVEQETPEAVLNDTQVQRRLAHLLGQLSQDRRTAIVLHHVQGYSISEIAQMTDALPNTVRDRLQVGRKQLRQKILLDPLLQEWGKRWR